jgi:hypothetical protein
MRKTILTCCLLLAAAAFAPRAFSQDAAKPAETAKAPEPPAHYYHLEFVVQELGADGKATNSRSYTTTVSTDSRESQSSIRTGSRIPIATGSFSSGGDNNKPLVNTQFQYIDVGVNIDARRTREIGRQLSIDLTADVSSVASATDPALHQPVVRQDKWQAVVLIAVGKPTVVFTSDSLDSKGSMQLAVTATPLQ